MTLITCSGCETQVSASARSCPSCGASAKVLRRAQGQKKGLSLWAKLGIGFLGFCILAAIVQTGEPDQPPQLTQEEKADQHRAKMAYDAVVTVKPTLREPDSAEFDTIRVNDDGSVVCLLYHGRNGFGGMSRDHTVFVDGEPSSSVSSWRRHCAHKKMYDYTGTARVAAWAGN